MDALPQTWAALLTHPEAVALRVLGFVASDRPELDRFLSETGLSQGDLKRVPICLEYLAAILDFLVTNEAALLRFARAVDLPPEAVHEARHMFDRRRPMRENGELRADRSVVTAAPHRLQANDLSIRVAGQCSRLLRTIGPAVSLECRHSHGNALAWPATGAT